MPSVRFYAINTISVLVFLTLLFTYGCAKIEENAGPKVKPKDEEILARVGDEVITIIEYKDEFTILPATYRNVAALYKDQFLESLVNKHLLLQEAKRENLQNSENVDKLLKRVKEEIMIQELIKRQVIDKAEPHDSEIEEYYKKNQDNYMEPPKIKAAHILVDSEVIAIKILDDLKRGIDFGELAKEYSLDIPTKDKGGDLGYFANGTLLPEFEKACEGLEVGEISGVVKTALGYHIIKIFDKKEAEQMTLEEAKSAIKSELLQEKQVGLYDSFLQRLKEGQKISINKELLEKTTLGP